MKIMWLTIIGALVVLLWFLDCAAAIRVMLDWREGMALAKEHGLELQRFVKAKVDYHDHAERIKGYLFKAGLREDER